MKGKIRKFISIFACIMLIVTFSLPAFATNNSSSNTQSFKDVPRGYWAYDQIAWMLDKNIISGYNNGLFGPDGVVTRGQFAKMMVLTLNLQLYYPATPSFLDVGRNAWEFPYVESAKPYLTGFRTSAGDNFKSSQNAVREDMAVALVKALGYQNETSDESLLTKFADAGQISPNLRKYIALSLKHGLVEGYTQNGQWLFSPQGNLTRAQAATLLYKAFKSAEGKVTYDDESKVTYDDNYIKPAVSVNTQNNRLVVSWNKIDSTKLAGYMVVISKNDSTPTYPDNGFLYYITDKSKTSAVIDNSAPYNGTSDFGQYLAKNEKYYVSVTAVYNDRFVAGNTVRKAYPGANTPNLYPAPTVSLAVENGKLVVKWNRIDSSEFKEYRVVISKNNSAPKYPANGYLYSITDRNTTSAVIDNSLEYNGNSDFGKYLVTGQSYVFSVTAVYKNRTVAGNAVRYVYPGVNSDAYYLAATVYSTVENGKQVLRWDKIDSPNLIGYRVVVSKGDSTPSYPDNGFLCNITDRNRDYAVLESNTAYTGGDFGSYLVKGEKYYFSVTAEYKDRTVAGNTIELTYTGDDNPALYSKPHVSAAYDTTGSSLIISWDPIDSPQLVEYRLVISEKTVNPAYPANGFYKVYDKNTTSAAIDASVKYTNGDLDTLTYGTKYYFSITAVYAGSKYVPGNAVEKIYVPNP